MTDILTLAESALDDFECEYYHCKMPMLQYQLDDMDKENRKLREAVIFERAQYIWCHRKCEDGKVAFAVAERELRAEGGNRIDDKID